MKEFWRTEQITEQQFLNMADTFDVLLFKCNHAGGSITRFYTGSEFDHAAMVLRFDAPTKGNTNDVYLIEATGNQGVRVKRWSNIKGNTGKFYQRIVLRHLQFDRNESALAKLEQFLKEVNGKSYGFSASHLIKRDTVMIKKRGSTEEKIVEDDRTFFCSELVAKAYKVCGIMAPTDEASSNFLPIDFTTEGKRLKLVPGASLDNEM